MDKAFRGHIDWRPDVYILEFGCCGFGESEICDFGDPIVDEDVGHLQITMDYPCLAEIHKPFEYGLYVWFCLLLPHQLFCLEFWFKISLVTKFRDYVAVSVAGEDLMALEDVGMIQLFEYFDLRKKQLF